MKLSHSHGRRRHKSRRDELEPIIIGLPQERHEVSEPDSREKSKSEDTSPTDVFAPSEPRNSRAPAESSSLSWQPVDARVSDDEWDERDMPDPSPNPGDAPWKRQLEKRKAEQYYGGVVTVEKISRVGREIGFADLSIKEVARRLGVTPAAIYKRIASRQELNFLVASAVFAEVEMPKNEGNLRDFLLRTGVTLYDIYIENPGLVESGAHIWWTDGGSRDFTSVCMDVICQYGYTRAVADAIFSSIENLAAGMHFYVRRMRTLIGEEDYKIGVGSHLANSKQTVTLMLAPYIDGLLAAFDGKATLDTAVNKIVENLPKGLMEPMEPNPHYDPECE